MPNGNDRSATAIRPKLKPIATSVARVGQGLVRPSEYFSPSAQAISSKPAQSNASHPLTAVNSHGFADEKGESASFSRLAR
ncbi:hypothetical protein [Bradyrhizobium sp.]|uniref:hypothetical protein n=1 Tax=Bradyrhizobium sp. TaxID=376 RepID=UPI0025BB3A99|nr:hypothetical protein [Bradyrhizobium sp.]